MIMTVSQSELKAKAVAAASLGAKPQIVGGWIWAQFSSKPDSETIEKMKNLNYTWSRAKRRWYFKGAWRCRWVACRVEIQELVSRNH